MLTYFKSFTLDSPVFCSVAMLMSSKILLWIYQSFTLLLCLLTSKVLLWIHQSFTLLLCLWVQKIYSAFTSLSLCCYAYEFKKFTLHSPVFHSVAMLMSSKNLLCIYQSFTLLLCLWVQKIYSAFTSLSLCCYAYEFKRFTLHLLVFHSVAMLMSSKDLLCIYRSFTLLLCLWVQKIYSAFTGLSLCCYAYEFKRFTLHLPVFRSVAMLMSSKNLLCIYQSFALLLCLWVQKIYSAFTSLSLCCYAYEFKRFTLHLPVFRSVAMLMSSKDLLCIYQSFALLLCLWVQKIYSAFTSLSLCCYAYEFKKFTLHLPVFHSVAMLMSSKNLLCIYQSFTLLLCLWVQKIYSAFTSLSLCCYAYEFKRFTLHLPVFHSVAMLMSSKNLLCIYQSFTLLLCLWVQKIYSAFTSLSLCCYAYEFKKFTLHLPVFHSVAMLMSSKNLLCIYQSFTLLLCLWVQKIYSAFTSLSLCCYAYEFKKFTLHLPVFHSVAMLMSSKNLLCIYQSFTLLLCLWVQKIYSAFTSLSLCCYAYEFKRFTLHLPVFHSVAMLMSSKNLLCIYQSFTLLLCLWVQKIYSAFTGLSLCCYAYEFKKFTLHLPVFHSVAMLMSSKNLLCIYRSFTLLLCLWVQKIYSAFTSLSLCCYAYEFKKFTLHLPVFHSVAMLMSSKNLLCIYQSFTLLLCLLTSKNLLCIYQSFTLLLCLWVQKIYSAFTSLSLCCYAYEFKRFTLHFPVFHSVAMLMSSKDLLCIYQSFTLLLCLWVQKIYSAFTSLSLCCYAYEFKKFTLHLPVFHSVAMLMSSKNLLCIYQSFTLLQCLWVQKIYSAFTSLSLCCNAYEFKKFTLHLPVFHSVAMLTYFKKFTLHLPVFHSVAMLMSSKNLLCIYQSFTLLLCLWVQKIYSAFPSLSLCCYAYEFKRFTLHLPVFHSVAMLMSSKNLLCIYQSFTLLLCLWVQKIYSAFTSLSLCCNAYEFKKFTLHLPVFHSVAMLMSSKNLLCIYQSFTLLQCLWVQKIYSAFTSLSLCCYAYLLQKIYSAFTSLSLCCYAYEFKRFTLHFPVFHSVAMLMSSKDLLCIYQSFTLLLCLWVQKIYSAFTSLSLCCYAYEFKKFTLHLPVFHSVAMLMSSKNLLCIYQSFTLLQCLWVQKIYSAFTSLSLCCYAYLLQKIYSAFTSLSLCCYAYEFKKFTLHLPVFHSVAMLMSSKDLLCISQSFTLLLCLWVQKIYSAFTSLSLCCYAYEFKKFTLHLPVFHSVAMLMSSKNLLCIYQSFTLLLCFSLWANHRWPFLGLFTKDIFCDILTGWGCSDDWYPGDLYTTLCTSTMHLILLDIKMGYCAVSCINGTRFTIYARLFQLKL